MSVPVTVVILALLPLFGCLSDKAEVAAESTAQAELKTEAAYDRADEQTVAAQNVADEESLKASDEADAKIRKAQDEADRVSLAAYRNAEATAKTAHGLKTIPRQPVSLRP